MPYRIRFNGRRASGSHFLTKFRVDELPGGPMFIVEVWAPVDPAVDLLPDPAKHFDEHALMRISALNALPRIEAGLRDGSFRSVTEQPEDKRVVMMGITEDELRAAVRAPAEKRCRYQARRGGDLFCDAGFVDSKRPFTAERVRIPTSAFLCGTCTLPDSRVVCSRLHHAMVQRGDNPTESSMFAHAADCDLGNKASPPGVCNFLERQCWERVVENGEVHGSVQLSPLALHEAIDYLDAVWRDAVKAPLVKYDVLTVAGTLATPCTGKDDFQLKVSAIVDAFDGFQVPGKKGGTLDRMTEYLKSWSAERGIPHNEFATVAEAIGVLKKVARLRAGLLHSGDRARGDLEDAQRLLGVSLPAVSYAAEWNRLVASVAAALALVRQHVRRYGRDDTDAPPTVRA